MKVIELVAPYWKHLAIVLDFSESRIKTMEVKSHYKPEDACHQMFLEWLNGDSDLLGPVTWNTLIQCLKKLKLKDSVAETLDRFFSQVCGIDNIELMACIVIMHGYNSLM